MGSDYPAIIRCHQCVFPLGIDGFDKSTLLQYGQYERFAVPPRAVGNEPETTRMQIEPSPPQKPLSSLRPHHFGVSVPDLDAAVAWYDRMLGFTLERRLYIDKIPARVAFVRREQFRIEIFEVPGAAPLPDDRRAPNLDLRTHGNKHMCFEVPDVPRAVAALREAGADIAFELNVDGNPTAFIRDAAGNLIELLQPFAADRPAC
ncbi:VOC family protein [Burkholderia multivorans]|uniref:VOC family protein n=1 Tax=Burkholderia multivorans TaxID=87883 RepID=UPI0020B1FFC4|nr:VOC family protein [Burkholderia multivorans]